jgi:hypothetical protein
MPHERELIMKNGMICAAAVLFAGACTTPEPPPEYSWDNLRRVERSALERVYVHPQADFHRYRRVMLDRVEVSFDKNWDPKKGPGALKDMKPDEIRPRGAAR